MPEPKKSRTRRGAYARVYDGFPSHKKVVTIPREVRAEAIGTWTLCLSWSNEHLTDGFIPAHVVDHLGGTTVGADALVTSKLWRRRGAGFQFVNWSESQSTRDDVEKARRANAERQAEFRARRAGNTGSGDEGVTSDEPATNSQSKSTSTSTTQTTEDDRLTPPDGLTSQRQRVRERRSPQAGDEPGEPDLDAVSRALLEVAPDFDSEDSWTVLGRAQVAARNILDKGGARVKHPTEYIVGSIRKNPTGWAKFAYEGKLPT